MTSATDIIPDKRKLIGLVEQAAEGKLCLPNFQRDFVWPRDGVADLLRSVLRRYYVGSLLLLRCDPNNPPFEPQSLRGSGVSSRAARPDLLVLDGQQRLTSLLYALTAPDLSLKDSKKRRYFFVDLQLLVRDPDDEGIVFDRAEGELDGLDRAEEQYRRRILPCTVLLRTESFMAWRDGLDDWLRENDAEGHKAFRAGERDAWSRVVTGFQNFEVPLVELPKVDDGDPSSIGRVCAIFEKLNSTGVELSVYDLLTARLYRHGIRLHKLWTQACHSNERLRKWSGGKAENNKLGVLVLRTLALRRGLDPKPAVLIELKPEGFEEDWRRAATAMERALELIELVDDDGFGVFKDKWLPGWGPIPVLAALRAEIEDSNLGDEERSELRRWYWCNVFLERFSSGVESKSRKDYSEMLAHWNDGKPLPAVFAEAQARIGAKGYSVRSSASHSSAIYSGIFCLLAIRGARDWARAESIQLQKLQDHHIFPRAYLRGHEISKRPEVNTVLNRTLISGKTNGVIKKAAPAQYLENSAVVAPAHRATILEPHFIDNAGVAAMKRATSSASPADVAAAYESFLRARERAVVAEIRRVCGVIEE
jgi:hypothetical protein